MDQHELDIWHMRRALELANQGQGHVEPNPMVGCVIAQGAEIIGQGWHRKFGGPHAEVEALAMAGERARGATAYVTLEPCCHQGKTPPCSRAVIAAGIGRVVVAQRDPFPQVDGGGLAKLREAGVQVKLGLLEEDARRLNRPYLTLVEKGRPWIIAKWAITLDGKTASPSGSSQWISGQASRAIVHKLRGRVDAILVGRRTAELDDPSLTVRPPGIRTPLRIVVDTLASLASDSQLIRTARDVPVLIAVGADAEELQRRRLVEAGCEVFQTTGADHAARLECLLAELGRRRLTNLLVEGGGQLVGSLFDAHLIDEVHAFIAPKLIGGSAAPGPIGGTGIDRMSEATVLDRPEFEMVDGDLYLHGLVKRSDQPRRSGCA